MNSINIKIHLTKKQQQQPPPPPKKKSKKKSTKKKKKKKHKHWKVKLLQSMCLRPPRQIYAST